MPSRYTSIDQISMAVITQNSNTGRSDDDGSDVGMQSEKLPSAALLVYLECDADGNADDFAWGKMQEFIEDFIKKLSGIAVNVVPPLVEATSNVFNASAPDAVQQDLKNLGFEVGALIAPKNEKTKTKIEE